MGRKTQSFPFNRKVTHQRGQEIVNLGPPFGRRGRRFRFPQKETTPMELGRIQPVQRMACPECSKLLPEWGLDDFEKKPHCPHCQARVKLPDEAMAKLRQRKYLGQNLDLMG